MKKICIPVALMLVFFSVNSFAQGIHTDKTSHPLVDSAKNAGDDDTTDDDNVRSYEIGLEFGSDQSSHGLHAGKKLPYMEPSFTYSAPKGFYIGVSDKFIFVKDSGGFDVFALNPGWNIDLTDNTTLNFNLTHYWVRARTPLSISADLSDNVESYIDHWIGESEGRFTVDYEYYKSSSTIKTPGDIIFTPDISHTFKIGISKKTSLLIVPEGNVDFGTTNSYTHYLANVGDTALVQAYKKKKPTQNAPFALLDYNVIVTIDLKIGKFDLEPAFNYNGPIYKVKGVPSKPLAYGTINLVYTIQ